MGLYHSADFCHIYIPLSNYAKGCYMPNMYAFIASQKGHPLYLNKSESPTPNHCFLSSLVEIGPVVLEKNILKYFLIILLCQSLSPVECGHT